MVENLALSLVTKLVAQTVHSMVLWTVDLLVGGKVAVRIDE
jgi:hypothetical protein